MCTLYLTEDPGAHFITQTVCVLCFYSLYDSVKVVHRLTMKVQCKCQIESEMQVKFRCREDGYIEKRLRTLELHTDWHTAGPCALTQHNDLRCVHIKEYQ